MTASWAPEPDRPGRWKRWRTRGLFGIRWLLPAFLVVGGLVVVVIAVAAIGVVHAVRVDHRLQNLTAAVPVIETEVKADQLGPARAQLATIETDLAATNSTLYSSPDFRLLDILPVARQNLEAVRSSVHLALSLVGGGQQVFNAAGPLQSPTTGQLQAPLTGGRVPTATLRAVQAAVNSLVSSLPTSVTPPRQSFLLGRVRSAETKVWSQAVRRRSELAKLSDGLTILNDFSGANGPRRYLLAVGNTAEMRGAGGMILSYGVLNVNGGKISLGKFGPIADLKLAHPAKATFPADFTRAFGGLLPNQYWQEATIMSDFTVDAPVLDSMYTQATGQPVNGVIQVDSQGLSAILAGTGPVLDPKLGVVDTTNVVQLTLNQAYLDFPNRSNRQEYTSGVAREAFAALSSGRLTNFRPFVSALQYVFKTRHVILSSTNPSVEGAIQALGSGGALPGPGVDFAQLTVQNFAANKLDYYLYTGLAITGSRPGGGPVGHLQATIALVNAAPASTKSQTIFGPGPNTHDPPGEYRGLVTLYLPAGTHLGTTKADAMTTQPVVGTQNGLRTVTFLVTIPAGRRTNVTLDLDLRPRPRGPENLTIVPTPRVQPTSTVVKISS